MRLSIAVLITTAIAAPVVVPSAVEAAPEPTVRTGVPPIELLKVMASAIPMPSSPAYHLPSSQSDRRQLGNPQDRKYDQVIASLAEDGTTESRLPQAAYQSDPALTRAVDQSPRHLIYTCYLTSQDLRKRRIVSPFGLRVS